MLKNAFVAIVIFDAVIGIAAFAPACSHDPFVGPATKQYDCPLYCGQDSVGKKVCCPAWATCSGREDRPCGAPEYGTSRDAGAP